MKDKNQQKKDKNAFKRKLINEYIPYELIALATLRYYASLQEVGQLDIVEHVMRIEKINEAKAIDRCMSIFKTVSTKQSKLSQSYLVLLKDNMNDFLNLLKDE